MDNLDFKALGDLFTKPLKVARRYDGDFKMLAKIEIHRSQRDHNFDLAVWALYQSAGLKKVYTCNTHRVVCIRPTQRPTKTHKDRGAIEPGSIISVQIKVQMINLFFKPSNSVFVIRRGWRGLSGITGFLMTWIHLHDANMSSGLKWFGLFSLSVYILSQDS